MRALRDDVMETTKTMPPIDAASMTGQWLLVESGEPATIEAVITLRDGAIYRGMDIRGRYVVGERHVEIWQDNAPVAFFWHGSDDLLVGAQEYLFGDDEPYRVKMVLDRVKDGRVRGMELTLDLEPA